MKPAHKHHHAAETLSPQRHRGICTDSGRDGIIRRERPPMTKSTGSPSPVPHPRQGLEECRVHLQERHLREDTKLRRWPLAINGFSYKESGSKRDCRGYKNPKEIHGQRTVTSSCSGMDRKRKRMTWTLGTAVG